MLANKTRNAPHQHVSVDQCSFEADILDVAVSQCYVDIPHFWRDGSLNRGRSAKCARVA
jgi:hypothetical protein